MIVSIRVNVTDEQALYDLARESFLGPTGHSEEDVANATERLGTREAPKVTQCAIEVAAEADHRGLFEFLD